MFVYDIGLELIEIRSAHAFFKEYTLSVYSPATRAWYTVTEIAFGNFEKEFLCTRVSLHFSAPEYVESGLAECLCFFIKTPLHRILVL